MESVESVGFPQGTLFYRRWNPSDTVESVPDIFHEDQVQKSYGRSNIRAPFNFCENVGHVRHENVGYVRIEDVGDVRHEIVGQVRRENVGHVRRENVGHRATRKCGVFVSNYDFFIFIC